MYVHVPSAWISLSTYSCIVFLSILTFIFKTKNLMLISKSIAPIGLLFTFLAIITGALWGKPTWGVLWAWDARLTSMIILFVFYILYIASLKFIQQEDKAHKDLKYYCNIRINKHSNYQIFSRLVEHSTSTSKH